MNQNIFVTVALGLLIFIGGVVVGNLTAETTDAIVETTTDAVQSSFGDSTSDTTGDATTASVQNGDAVAFTLNIENIPEVQRVFLRTMGIEGDSIPVTNSMLVCAEASMGASRMAEIQNGATPSASEGLKLVGCYK